MKHPSFANLTRPQTLLGMALATTPLTFSLTGGDAVSGGRVAISLSDVLLLAALPDLFRFWISPNSPRKRKAESVESQASDGIARKVMLLLGLYCMVGLLSFGVNLSAMHGAYVSYFVGMLRTFQVALLLPLSFLVLPWSREEIGFLLKGLLGVSALLGVCVVGAFVGGVRGGMYILGMEKNSTGLAVAVGLLAALALLPRKCKTPSSEPPLFSPKYPFLPTALCGLLLVALACTLSRTSFLCFGAGLLVLAWVQHSWKLGLGVLVGLGIMVRVVMWFALPTMQNWVTNISTKSVSFSERGRKVALCVEDWRQHRVLGDGFRARRDILPHNLELTLLAENGLLGTLLILGLIGIQFHLFLQTYRQFAAQGKELRATLCLVFLVSAVAVFVHAQFDPYWRRGPLWIPWAGMGMVLSLRRESRTMEPE